MDICLSASKANAEYAKRPLSRRHSTRWRRSARPAVIPTKLWLSSLTLTVMQSKGHRCGSSNFPIPDNADRWSADTQAVEQARIVLDRAEAQRLMRTLDRLDSSVVRRLRDLRQRTAD